MKTFSVESSAIETLGWEDQSLFAKFKGGGCYRYSGVGKTHLESILNADSIGKAFHQIVKKGGFRYEKLEADPFI